MSSYGARDVFWSREMGNRVNDIEIEDRNEGARLRMAVNCAKKDLERYGFDIIKRCPDKWTCSGINCFVVDMKTYRLTFQFRANTSYFELTNFERTN